MGLRIGNRRFIGVEIFWTGWRYFAVGWSLGICPEIYIGPATIRIEED